MTEKIEETTKLLLEEGRRKGFLTYAEMSKLMDDQFIPPETMDQVFVALEDAGIEVLDDAASAEESLSKDDIAGAAASVAGGRPAVDPSRGVLPEKIDDPVRMYLTQMGEIPLLTRDQEIFLAKSIEVHWLEDGDHSFKPRVRSGRTFEQNLTEAMDAVAAFRASV